MKQTRFRVRPGYHSGELLIEVMGDHRAEGFPHVAGILRDRLGATAQRHPGNLDDPRIGLALDDYFTYWAYSGGHYEVSDDTWGLFLLASPYRATVIADIERALLESRQFVKEEVDFEEYK